MPEAMFVAGRAQYRERLASMAITADYGVSRIRLLRRFRSSGRRTSDRVRCGRERIEFFNDSKATNVDSAIKAVESFERGLILILRAGQGAP
jgi:UDP-N-acetylmuramoylalanine--D-glutamate ligase